MDKVQQAVNEMFKSKVFSTQQTNKRGEIYELKNELNGDTKDKRKEAVKKTIAQMTVGKDVSMLFADVVKNMQTDDLELKKLVYLYLINYAKSQPELVILAINTFVKDSDDINPLIRALAIRTMACLRVPKMLDYIAEPLRKSLNDQHPYVRKTAVIGVAKLYDLSPQLAIDNGFVSTLQDLLSDPNPMVVANSVAALLEIKASNNSFIFNIVVLNKLLAALNESTEWGQISILDALATHTPGDAREADMIIEKITPRLQHINSGVVLSAVKVLIVYLEHCSPAIQEQITRKLSPALVSLLAAPPEVQYVALRNISLILQKHPSVLQNEVRVFFCKYYDPLYVKLEKLQVIVKLSNDKNIDQVISELKEYANEVDIEFVRKSVGCLGECAINIEPAAERCVNALLDLIKNKVSHVVQEVVVVVKDIFRRYPNRFESVIPVLCESLELLEEPEAKAAIVWIIGENAHRIENAVELLDYFLETLKTDSVQVQLQFLTASVKLFLRKPQQGQDLVQKILKNTTENGESADLRDKAYFYWRLLSSDPAAAKTVVLADKPPIREQMKMNAILADLLKNLGSISSVYHKPASTFLTYNGPTSVVVPTKEESDDEQTSENITSGGVGDLLDLDLDAPPTSAGALATPSPAGGFIDLLSGSPPKPGYQDQSPAISARTASTMQQVMGTPAVEHQVYLSAAQAKGFELHGAILKKNGVVTMDLMFYNKSLVSMSDFAVQFNKNTLGLIPTSQPQIPSLPPNQSVQVSIPLANNGPAMRMEPINLLQVAIKNNVDVFYFQTLVPESFFQ